MPGAAAPGGANNALAPVSLNLNVKEHLNKTKLKKKDGTINKLREKANAHAKAEKEIRSQIELRDAQELNLYRRIENALCFGQAIVLSN